MNSPTKSAEKNSPNLGFHGVPDTLIKKIILNIGSLPGEWKCEFNFKKYQIYKPQICNN